jgi:hypothetical protein
MKLNKKKSKKTLIYWKEKDGANWEKAKQKGINV